MKYIPTNPHACMVRRVLLGILMQCCLFNMTMAGTFMDPVVAKVSGTVKSFDGIALPGVSVVVKGTNIGTITDVNGKYTVDAFEDGSVLSFSFIGYIAQEVPIQGRTTIDITLAEDTKALDEVVVIGYGTQKRSDLTGAVGSVNVDQLQERPAPSLN